MRMLGIDPGSASPSGAIYQALRGAKDYLEHTNHITINERIDAALAAHDAARKGA